MAALHFHRRRPQQGTPVFTGSLTSLHGWIDAHTLLASDMQNAYWITDDGRTTQTVPLKEIYGDDFDITGSDTFRVNPINPDLAARRRALRESSRRRADRSDGPRRSHLSSMK